jgi:hypothetical protein
MKTHGTSTGWTIVSYVRAERDLNWITQCVRDGEQREVRFYGEKPPEHGAAVTLSRD